MQTSRFVRSLSTKRVLSKNFVPQNVVEDTHGEFVKWLKASKRDELKEMAVAYGSPCSGTKEVLSRGLVDVLYSAKDGRPPPVDAQDLSIVSIDMGIRNLAYCHLRFTSNAGKQLDTKNKKRRDISIGTWRRLDVSTGTVHGLEPEKAASTTAKTKLAREGDDEATSAPLKESFDPTSYAERAYALVSRILEEHRPTQVLIERQRFRSGGGPAVQEWTLRVGMFEFMLYATLHTLKAQGVHNSDVVPVLPPMVNRFWMSELEKGGSKIDSKPTSAAMKRYKINQVKAILESGEALGRHLELSGQADELASEFLSKLNGNRRGAGTTSIPKLDDLSDCLLQGLAWVSWQEGRQNLRAIVASGLLPVDSLALDSESWPHT